MSKTKTHIKNGRNDRCSEDIYEYSDDFTKKFKDRWNGQEPCTHYDASRTTNDQFIRPRRHPNKKKHRSLNKEFAETECQYKIGNWRNPYGETNYKSFRLKGARKVGTRIRRARLKEQMNQEIKNSYED